MHERIHPLAAIQLAKDLEQFKLFFYEDPFAPEDNGYFELLRQHSIIPIAMGELYVNQAEYVNLIKDRLIDFIRVHISDIGGLSPARKLAAYCEFFNVRTAWHGPGDASPVAHAANLALDLSSSNFGIQEATMWGERSRRCSLARPNSVTDALVQRSARTGHRYQRGTGGNLSVPEAPDQWCVAGHPPARRRDCPTVDTVLDIAPAAIRFAAGAFQCSALIA